MEDRNKDRSLRALLRDTGGAAYTEAAIMLPLFVLVWGCIVFVHSGFREAIDHASLAREAAWAEVTDACQEGAGEDATAPLGFRGLAFLGEFDRVVAEVPFVGDYWPGVVVFEREFRDVVTIAQPGVLGGGEARAGHHLILSCNERARPDLSVSSMVGRAWSVLGL